MQWFCAQPGPQDGCVVPWCELSIVLGYVGMKHCNAEGRRGAELLQYPHGSPGVRKVLGRPTQFIPVNVF